MVGGAERVFSHLVRGFHRDPYEVELLALRDLGPIGEEIESWGVPARSGLTGSGRLDLGLPLRLRRYLSGRRFDAIYFLDHAHAVFYTTLASFGTGTRVRVMPVHTTGQWDGHPSLKRPIRMVRRRLDRIISIAEAQKRYLVEEEGVPAEQLVVIPNGIPVASPDAAARQMARAEARRVVGTSPDVFVIGITAVLRPEKNHELLLEALARMSGALPAVGKAPAPGSPSGGASAGGNASSAGVFPDGANRVSSELEVWVVGDGPRRAFLEERAAALGISEHVRFLGHRPDARDLMAGFDVAVLCSHPRVETLPLSLLEAMDAGVPVVATRVGALAEMVEEGRSGTLVEPGDAAALAEALTRLVRNADERAAWGERAQKIVRARYSVETMVASTERLLRELLERS